MAPDTALGPQNQDWTWVVALLTQLHAVLGHEAGEVRLICEARQWELGLHLRLGEGDPQSWNGAP